MARSKATTIQQEREIFRLVQEGYSAAQIERHLDELGLIDADSISRRTIERRVTEIRKQDKSETWSVAEADRDTASLVLEHIAHVFSGQFARQWPTRDLAAWVVRVRTICPRMDAGLAHRVVSEYLRLSYAKEDTRHLDLLLGTRPWEGPKQVKLWLACMGTLIAEYEPDSFDDAEELYYALTLDTYGTFDATPFENAWNSARERQRTEGRSTVPSPHPFDDELF